VLAPLTRSTAVQRAAGRAAAGYLKFVRATSRIVAEPVDFPAAYAPLWPVIITAWHGEHMLTPFVLRSGQDIRVLISRSGDGEIGAAFAAAFGCSVIRGAGGPARKSRKRGGAAALRSMLRALEDGASVAMTADVPKLSRVVGAGIITLARLSGRPIVPIAVAARHHVRLERSWDQFALGLPFGRIAMVAGDPMVIPSGHDEANLEQRRSALAAALDATVVRAYELANGGAR
jgi:lysophospholipid acyltransferase (LPLAT)-like uncharacterized protein